MGTAFATTRGTVRPRETDHAGHSNARLCTSRRDEASVLPLSPFGVTGSCLRRGIAGLEQHTSGRRAIHHGGGTLVRVRSETASAAARIVRGPHRESAARRSGTLAPRLAARLAERLG